MRVLEDLYNDFIELGWKHLLNFKTLDVFQKGKFSINISKNGYRLFYKEKTVDEGLSDVEKYIVGKIIERLGKIYEK